MYGRSFPRNSCFSMDSLLYNPLVSPQVDDLLHPQVLQKLIGTRRALLVPLVGFVIIGKSEVGIIGHIESVETLPIIAFVAMVHLGTVETILASFLDRHDLPQDAQTGV